MERPLKLHALHDGSRATVRSVGDALKLASIQLIAEAPLRLGPLMIDPPRRRLIHDDGREEILEPRVMQVLVALAKSPRAILSREDLMTCCWDGRIVGDDALNRVMSRLRRVSHEIGAGILRLETITKVGFRLILLEAPDDRHEPSADATTAALSAVPAPPLLLAATGEMGPGEMRPGARRVTLLGGAVVTGALLIVALLATGLWRSAATRPSIPELQVATFQNVSPAVAPGAEQTLREEMVAAFGRSSTQRLLSDDGKPMAGSLSFRLSGSVQRLGAGLRFAFNLTRNGADTVIWSTIVDRPSPDVAMASRQVATQISFTVRCVLVGDASYRGSLPDAVLSDYAKACAEVGSSESGEAVSRMTEDLRQAVAKAPDFAAGWAMLGYVIADKFAYPAALWDNGSRAEAMQAVDRALRLDPTSSEGHVAKALLTPWRNYITRDDELRLAVGEPDPFGSANAAYARFLLSVGRSKESAFMAERGYDLDPNDRDVITRLVQAFYLMDRVPEADALVARAEAQWSDSSKLTINEVWAAFWDGHHQAAVESLRSGRYDEAIRTVGPDAGPTPPIADAGMAVFAALDSGTAAARPAAAETVARLAADPRRAIDPLAPVALAALGRDQDALMAEERVVREWSTSLTFLLFTPPFASARRTPQFAALAGRLGLLSYWRRAGRAPDFCSEADPPPVCRQVH